MSGAGVEPMGWDGARERALADEERGLRRRLERLSAPRSVARGGSAWTPAPIQAELGRAGQGEAARIEARLVEIVEERRQMHADWQAEYSMWAD